MNTPLQSLAWRYATKKFDATKAITAQDMQTLLECLRLSPSSFGLQPWKFLVIEDAQTRASLKEHSWGQEQITDASAMIVLCARTDVNDSYVQKYVQHMADVRGLDVQALETFEQMILGSLGKLSAEEVLGWNKRQVYIALGVLLSCAASMGIDACPMEGFDAAKYDELLGLASKNLTATVTCTLGYRSADDASAQYRKVRFPTDEVIIRL